MVLVAALALGCGPVQAVDAPIPAPLVNGKPAVETAPPAGAARAIDAISDAYANLVGVDVRDVGIRVHWAVAMPPGLLGATWHNSNSGCDTWLISDAMFAYPMVLPHEIGHCARWLLTGDGDPAHLDETWWGDLGYVKLALAAERSAGI